MPVAKTMAKGTVAGNYKKFVSKMLDQIDRFPKMRNFYIVMDNAPIHASQDITNLIETRDYRTTVYICLHILLS